MRFSLRVRSPDGESFHYLFEKEEVLVGRDEPVDVRLPHAAVSLVHLRLRVQRGRLCAEDVGSTNGTWLDGRRLAPGERHELRPGAQLRIAPFELAVELDAAGAVTGPADTASFARAMLLGLLGLGEERAPSIVVLNGPQRGERRELAAGASLVVGRGEGCGLRLDDADTSRQHLELSRDGAAVHARDLGSKNGVLLDGARLEGEGTVAPGAVLQIGQTRLQLEAAAERLLAEVTGVPDQRLAPPPDVEAAVNEPLPAVASEPDAPPPPRAVAVRPGRGMVVLGLIAALLLCGAIAAIAVLLS
jgi:pSer/pThr/pTyr-binding forkhead associated (FHA) protein